MSRAVFGRWNSVRKMFRRAIDVSEIPIESFTEKGLQVGDTEYEFDAVVFATGFDAMTGALNRIDIRGLGGLPLKKKWAAGPRTYLGHVRAGP